MVGVVYDTGALVAAARGGATMWRVHRLALEGGGKPMVPAPVLAQAWRGGAKQALLARLLQGCELMDFTVVSAYAVGRLLSTAGTSDATDAAVALLAAERGDAIVTSDPEDMRHLGSTLGVRITLKAV